MKKLVERMLLALCAWLDVSVPCTNADSKCVLLDSGGTLSPNRPWVFATNDDDAEWGGATSSDIVEGMRAVGALGINTGPAFESVVLEFDGPIPRSLISSPPLLGTILVSKTGSRDRSIQWQVSQWVDNPDEHILGLGKFWGHTNAQIFAYAKAADLRSS